MRENKMTRSSCSYYAPTSTVKVTADKSILSDYERGTAIAAAVLTLMFGCMMLIGAWFGW